MFAGGIMSLKNALAICASLTLSTATYAGQKYVNISLGSGNINIDCTGANTCSRSSPGYKVIGGVKLNNRWAAELTYFNFGSSEFGVVDTNTIPGGTIIINDSIKASGAGIGFSRAFPITDSQSFTTKFGVANVTGVEELNGTGTSGNRTSKINESGSKNKNSLYFGITFEMEIVPEVSANWSLDISSTQAPSTTSGGVGLFSLGITYKFN
jgi:OmpA-OmpF porin, OOP family